MTRTGRWFESRRRELLVREGTGVVLGTVGSVLAALTLGVIAAKSGLFGAVPPLVLLAWGLVVSASVAGFFVYRRRSQSFRHAAIAESVESVGSLRRGSLLGMVFGVANGSPSLVEAADSQSRQWLDSHGKDALHNMRRRGARSMWSGALVGVVGASIFAASNPLHPGAGRFWNPIATLAPGAGVVTIDVDRDRVSRGESVNVTIHVTSGDDAQLFMREPGEAWSSRPIVLDSTGTAVVRLGPLNADRFLRAEALGRESGTVRVVVDIPAFLADLTLYARFPEYLARLDEAVQPGDSVLLPAGTSLVTTGSATVGLEEVRWRAPDGRGIPLAVDQSSFEGITSVQGSGVWTLEVVPVDGRVLDQAEPTVTVTVVRDSIPLISVPLPGVDTVAPPSLRQPVVVDVRDDHGLTLVEAVTRRAGDAMSDARVDTLLFPDAATDRAVLSWLLDLNDRGFGPGDTAYYRIRALDNAPQPNRAESREFALRLPSESELRQAIRDATQQLAADADSLRSRQEDLARETESLAATQERLDDEQRRGEEGLEFSQAERANEVAEEQTELIEQAEQLSEDLQEIAESAWEAGMTDPEWHKQLAELQEMMEQSVTPEMEASLEQLQQALENLDPEAMREALERMVEQQQQMQEQMERSQELFERAAMEGAMSTLAEDAEDIAERQEELNDAMEAGEMSDSSAARSQEQLASDTEQLQEQLDRLESTMQEAGEESEGVQRSEQQAGNAAQNMQQGAQQSQQGQSQQAQQSGEQASQQLESIPQDLREQLEQMRGDWKDEVLQQMDMALAETADLARRQSELSNRMQRGESGADVMGEQAAVRQGVDQIIERLQDAAGKNALVSPNLSTSLGFSRLKMTESLGQFEQPTPNTRQAGQLASEALDGLNAVAAALLRSRGDVEGSQSGSGMAEAMEQMAQMAAQQEALNAETGGVMPLMPQGGEQLLQQLQQLADQQQSLGEELEGMAAQEGLPDAAEELAEEAIEIAEQLAAGRLDAETLERQEDLFRKLLDAGRSLRSDEEDDEKERQSVTAAQDVVGEPRPFDPASAGPGVRYPYPSWDQLRRYSAEERRIILNYFRRLNAGRP